MNEIIILFLVTIILIIIAYFNLGCITDFNPFKNRVKIPNKVVESFLGDDMKLNKNTDKTNPLIKHGKKMGRNKNHRNLVFTSAGNNTEFDNLWIGREQNYDIMVVYYGDEQERYDRYASKVDYILKRKGSKFQNFGFVYKNHKEIIDKYDRFFILDDDIIFKTKDINEMFKLSKQYNFWICGPTYKNTPDCKISHPVTVSESGNLFRYTDFIEVGVPLFNRTALDKLMEYYDNELIGWGIDFLYIWVCGKNEKKKFALIDKITCINPHDNAKKNKREMSNIKNFKNESVYWHKFSKKHGIPYQWKGKTWERVKI
jgi:hypothetical protein